MRFDVIVAGMGIHGLMTTYMLAQRGLKVAAVDPYVIPHKQGSSHGRTRVHRRAYFEAPFYVPLLQRSDVLWDQFTNEWDFAVLKRIGVLVMGQDDGRLTGGSLAAARKHAIPVEVLSASEVMQRWPGLRMPSDYQAVYERGGGVLQVEHVLQRLRRLAAELGVQYITGRIENWDKDYDGIQVVLQNEETPLRTDRLVLAAGAWLGGLTKLKLPLTTERQFQVHFATEKGSGYGAMQFPAIAIDRGSAPMLYGIPDFGKGFKLAFHHGGLTGDPETFDPVEQTEIDRLHYVSSQWLPGISSTARQAWTCIYTNTPDEHFIIDRHPATDRVVILSCCSGHGYKFSPVVGEIASQLITDGGTSHDISQFRLDRFKQL